MTELATTDDAVRATTIAQAERYLELLRAHDWDAWIALWADDAVLGFPFVPKGRIRTYYGKKDILEYMAGTTENVVIDGVTDLQLIPALDPTKVVVELEIAGHLIQNGAVYNQRYVTVFEYEDGLIRHYREYWNPLVYTDAVGDPDAWVKEPGR
jgi:ketosteroid isomerase-like protein